MYHSWILAQVEWILGDGWVVLLVSGSSFPPDGLGVRRIENGVPRKGETEMGVYVRVPDV